MPRIKTRLEKIPATIAAGEAPKQATQSPLQPIYLTPAQVAEKYNLKKATLDAWRHRGIGPRWIRISIRKCVYDEAAVVAWLKGREVQSTAEADLLPKGA